MTTGSKPYANLASGQRRDEMIVSHLSLVRHILGRLLPAAPAGTDMENLEAAGVLGLVEAAGHFEPARGTNFETFAYPRVRGAILDEIRRNCPLPQAVLKLVRRVRSAYDILPRPVSVHALAAATGLSEDQVTECLGAMRLMRLLSLDTANEPEISGLTPSPELPDQAAERAEQQKLLAVAIEGLAPMERRVVTLYFLEDLRLKEIGRLVGLSESRVSRVLDAALFHLGEAMRESDE